MGLSGRSLKGTGLTISHTSSMGRNRATEMDTMGSSSSSNSTVRMIHGIGRGAGISSSSGSSLTETGRGSTEAEATETGRVIPHKGGAEAAGVIQGVAITSSIVVTDAYSRQERLQHCKWNV